MTVQQFGQFTQVLNMYFCAFAVAGSDWLRGRLNMRVLKPARNAASRGKFFAQAAAWRTSALKDSKNC
jgi:hypothetical protein